MGNNITETIFEVLVRIKEKCDNTEDCKDCPFKLIEADKGHECQITALGEQELQYAPSDWNLEHIKDILDK